MSSNVAHLHPLEIKLLRALDPQDIITSDLVLKKTGFNQGQCNQAISWLQGKDALEEMSRESKTLYERTALGEIWDKEGIPAERIFQTVEVRGPLTLPEVGEILGFDQTTIGKAFGLLSKEGILSLDNEKKINMSGPYSKTVKILRGLLDRADLTEGVLDPETLSQEELDVMNGFSKKRQAVGVPFKIVDREFVSYKLTPEGVSLQQVIEEKGLTGDEIGMLTSSMLATGTWKKKSFRSYAVDSPPQRVILGRTNPYADYIRWVKSKLVGLGFQEFDGPLVVDEFWNGDALFMPQFHSARDIHDVYYVDNPSHAKEIEQPWLDNVAAMHEHGGDTESRGWGYSFDRDFTRRLVMRSQGTVLSATQLKDAEIPGKYFGIARCFRYDQVDATHGADFYQTEGIVLGDHVNLRTLLGLLKIFAEEIAGAEEVRYVPGYFPFTEPSIEVHIKHPKLGWFELGGSGIFRPEVTKAMGIDVPVLAWGLGIDRMAMMHLGISDMRELFTDDIDAVRMRRGK